GGGSRWTRSRGAVRRALPPAGRDALIAGIAEALLLERALPELLDPDAHAVTAVVSQVGATGSAGGVEIVCQALSTKAWLDAAAAHGTDGTIAPLPRPRAARPRDAAIVLRGLFVRAALGNEHGTWMIRAAAAEPDVVRVEIRGGATAAPVDV